MSHLPPAESASEVLLTTIVTIPDSDEVIEGEILETQSEVPLEQSLLNFATNPVRDSQQQSEAIASWLLLQEDAIFGTDHLSPLKNWLAFFLTPCRFMALGVLLLANLLLVWSQLSVPKSGASLQATGKFSTPVPQPPIKEIAPGLNLAAEKSQLAFNSLSTAPPAASPAASAIASLPTPQAAPVVTTATASFPTPQSAPVATLPTPQTAPVATLPTPQTAPVVTTATADLPTPQATHRGTAATPSPSNTLFYYYYPAQPAQPVQSYPNTQVTTAPLPTAPSSQSSPVPVPQLPSVQQPPAVQPPSPPTPEDLGKQSIIRQDLDRLRLEQENQPPLGFNQEYRIKVQSYQNQTDPTQLRQQLQQLQQQATPTKLK